MPKWLAYTLLTVLLWGLWGVACKAVSAELPAWQLQVLSLLGVAPVVLALFRKVKLPEHTRERQALYWSLGAGLLGSVGNLACFQAMSAGGKAAAVVPLTSLYPITTIVLALLFLNERPSLVQTIGLCLSLVAIWLFNVVDDSAMISSWLLVSLLPIICWGIGGFIQKFATLRITGEQCTLAFLLGFFPMVLTVFFYDATWTNIAPQTWVLATISGLLFALGNFTVTLAYRSGGRAVVVTPIAGLYMLVTVPLAIGILHESITTREVWGIAVSMLAVVALCYERPAATKPVAVAITFFLASSGETICRVFSI